MRSYLMLVVKDFFIRFTDYSQNGREPVAVPGLNPYSQSGALSSLQFFHFIKRKANTFSDFLKSKRSIK